MDLDSDNWDFTFAYDVKDFSDRLLRIEICDGVPMSKFLCLIKPSIQYGAAENENVPDADTNNEEQDVNCEEQDVNCEVQNVNCEEQNVNRSMPNEPEEAMETSDNDNSEPSSTVDTIEASTVGSFDASSTESEASSAEDSFEVNIDESYSKPTSVLCVKTIHINSFILAEKSVFFNELFLNEPKNSEQRDVTVRINVSEEVAFFDLLKFMYSNTLSASTSPNSLIEVILVADKYKVLSCMKHCSKCLQLFEMTSMTAVTYLKLSLNVRMVEGVQPIVDAAKEYLTGYFNNFEKLHELAILPLLGIEVVLSSDGLQVPNEDIIYDFLVRWVEIHHSQPDKRRKIMTTRLSKLIRFHYMSCKMLGSVLASPYFDSSVSSKLVHDALFFQAEPQQSQGALILAGYFSIKRAYTYILSGIEKFQLPRPQCTAYVDLKLEECIGLPTNRSGVYKIFYLNKDGFYVNMLYKLDPETGYDCFGLVLGMLYKCIGSTPLKVSVIISAMQRPSEKFMVKYNGDFTFDGRANACYTDLFAMPWSDLMADDCVYFIDGSLHLMLELMVIN